MSIKPLHLWVFSFLYFLETLHTKLIMISIRHPHSSVWPIFNICMECNWQYDFCYH